MTSTSPAPSATLAAPPATGAGPGSTVVIGGGPAGLTAALHLAERGNDVVVYEATDALGGISQTVERAGWRFDIGGHRFFTKVPAVEALWDRILGPHEFLVRPRLSRIYYDGRFYDYPLNARNALRNLGPFRAAMCVASYGWARIHPPRDRSTFEGWVQARFGRRLYETFFKTYTEKVWGMPASSIQADWAAQRIKDLSLGRAIRNALTGGRSGSGITSLIERFRYPRNGPGMMWEACAEMVQRAGGTVVRNAPVVELRHRAGRVTEVVVEHRATVGSDGGEARRTVEAVACSAVISSMPIGELVASMSPPPPDHVLAAARALRHRDFLTVALVVPEDTGFPDNWIYVHSPEVRVGRVQNFGVWSPDMVRPGTTCLGLEYFVHEGDDLWSMDDDDLVALGERELVRLGLLGAGQVQRGFVVRMPKAYPVYDAAYHENVATLRSWLEAHTANVQPVGRNGMHRYNNQDHSMVTAMYAVENLLDRAGHDLWSVNVEEDYHEEAAGSPTDSQQGSPATSGSHGSRPAGGTGRSAPVPIPAR